MRIVHPKLTALDPPLPATPSPVTPDRPQPDTPPVIEPVPVERPMHTPVPGTPSITPREVPTHPGQPPQPAKEHPADPQPQEPIGSAS